MSENVAISRKTVLEMLENGKTKDEIYDEVYKERGLPKNQWLRAIKEMDLPKARKKSFIIIDDDRESIDSSIEQGVENDEPEEEEINTYLEASTVESGSTFEERSEF